MTIYLEEKEMQVAEGTSVMQLLKDTGTEITPSLLIRHEVLKEVPSMNFREPPKYVVDYVEESYLMRMDYAGRVLRDRDQVEPLYFEEGG